MRTLKKLNITKSIQSKKLTFEESWSDKFDTFFNYFMFILLTITSILALKEINPNSPNDTIGYFIFPLVIVFSLYAFYCKFSEKNLKEIKFDIHKEDAKQRILEHGKKYNYRISKISNNLIFLNEPTSESNLGFGNYEKTIIIFFKDNSILYTLIKEGWRINFPVLFSQHIVRSDFKKILKARK